MSDKAYLRGFALWVETRQVFCRDLSGPAMSSQEKSEGSQQLAEAEKQLGSYSYANWADKIQDQYQKIKENAETYPYVWGSYIVVYGGFGLWFAYRWRKLFKSESRVRVLQERLRKLVQAEESTSSSSAATSKAPPSFDISTK
ncbi:hypothetical protein RND71_007945 [Anisodus tanguticus]|uniref:Uncharacterized protein n=1 Tax=Anisodus tanguticus TaxID=243964 RepID=A0AAE1SPX1_9SOLA|nr:hypothetical protein RND71_007945 [Anisodus tanguticus]